MKQYTYISKTQLSNDVNNGISLPEACVYELRIP